MHYKHKDYLIMKSHDLSVVIYLLHADVTGGPIT